MVSVASRSRTDGFIVVDGRGWDAKELDATPASVGCGDLGVSIIGEALIDGFVSPDIEVKDEGC